MHIIYGIAVTGAVLCYIKLCGYCDYLRKQSAWVVDVGQ